MKTQSVGFNCLHGLLIGSSFSEGALKAASSPQSFAIFASSSCDRYSETEAKTVMRLGWIKIALSLLARRIREEIAQHTRSVQLELPIV